MDDEESLQPQKIVLRDVPPTRPTLTPYELLLEQSRKIGQTATRTYDVTWQFLNRDVPLDRASALPEKLSNAAKSARKLNRIVRQSQEILADAKTVPLPSNIFPDRVTLDRTKVTIVQKTFFWSANVVSIRIEDVLNVATSVGPFFGSLTISSRVMNSTDHYEIEGFWRKDAIKLKHLIQGYMIAVHNDIDTSRLTSEELIERLEELGHEPGQRT